MASIPKLKSLLHILFDEQKCIDFLFEQNILYANPNCTLCLAAMRREKKLWRCKNFRCNKTCSIFTGSFFAKARITCDEVMHIAYLWLTKASYSTALIHTHHSSPTITEYYNYLRQLVTDNLNFEDTMIGGENIIVEIDESKFGRRKYHRGHRVEGVWVLGGIERTEERKLFLIPVPNRNEETLLNAISTHVRPGSIIHTDLWRGYHNIENRLGMQHNTVNHSLEFVDNTTGTHTNTIEGTWGGMKLIIAPRNRTEECIESRLFEFIWRRKHENNLWSALIQALREVLYL